MRMNKIHLSNNSKQLVIPKTKKKIKKEEWMFQEVQKLRLKGLAQALQNKKEIQSKITRIIWNLHFKTAKIFRTNKDVSIHIYDELSYLIY